MFPPQCGMSGEPLDSCGIQWSRETPQELSPWRRGGLRTTPRKASGSQLMELHHLGYFRVDIHAKLNRTMENENVLFTQSGGRATRQLLIFRSRISVIPFIGFEHEKGNQTTLFIPFAGLMA